MNPRIRGLHHRAWRCSDSLRQWQATKPPRAA